VVCSVKCTCQIVTPYKIKHHHRERSPLHTCKCRCVPSAWGVARSSNTPRRGRSRKTPAAMESSGHSWVGADCMTEQGSATLRVRGLSDLHWACARADIELHAPAAETQNYVTGNWVKVALAAYEKNRFTAIQL
jgi:hypothetical protein